MPQIHTGYLPGIIGRVAEMHAIYYAAHWNFGSYFEIKVVTGLSEFFSRYNSEQDATWSVVSDDRIEGSLTIDGIHAKEEGAHLRWFIMSDHLRGQGLGNALMQNALEFCKAHNYPCIYLWTFAGLHAARKLYDKAGFALVYESIGNQWGTEVTEQKLVLELL